MKRHVQQPGIRQWAGDDFLDLQTEPLRILDEFFEEYGPCIIKGVHITQSTGDLYNVSAGLVALSGTDAEGKETFKVVPFAGIDNMPLPLYLTLTHSVVTRPYVDGEVKPVAYDYRAAVTTVKPDSAAYLELGMDTAPRFTDVIQDESHRFMTDKEKGDILTKTNASPFTPTGDYQPATKKYVDDKDRVVNIPYSLFGLTSKSSSSQILAVFGGLSEYKKTVDKLRAANCMIICGGPDEDSYRYIFDNYTTEWTDGDNFILYLYDVTYRSALPKVLNFQIKLVNNEASFAKSEQDFAVLKDTCKYVFDLRETDLNSFKGTEGDIALIGVQRNNVLATSEHHYPVEEAGILIVSGTITDKTNQIYHTYNSNRIFIRCATSSGSTGEFSDWVELAKVTDVLTKTNTSSFTPTGDYQPATKKYVDITTTKFVQLGTSNLNDFVGSDSEGFIGVQTYGANATLDRNYPIAESGMLICAGSINQRTNQIYQTFNSNRTFTRGAGINEFTPWKELVSINDVLSKTNTTEYTPTSDFHPATKKYVDENKYGKIIEANIARWLVRGEFEGFDDNNQIVKGLFGSIGNIKSIVDDILNNHTKYYFSLRNDNSYYRTELSNVFALKSSKNEYTLEFTVSYSHDNTLNINVVAVVVRIDVNDNANNKLIIKDVITSQNINAITKMTSSEYEALGTKDDKTAYCITD